MYLLQVAATQQQQFDDACAAATTQATQGQPCIVALNTLTFNMDSCTPTPQNPTIICEGVCRGYYDDIFDNCPTVVSLFTIVTSCINQLVTAY